MSLPRIFVHIPSYRDRECQWTLKDLFEKARHPERVFVGVCWQTLPEEDWDCFQIAPPRPDQVRAVHFHIGEALGLGWARGHASSLWQGEEYSLQIDSHMRFAPDWDQKMLDMLAVCDSPDPVLTLYPPSYLPPDRLSEPGAPQLQCIKEFSSSGLLEFTARPVPAGTRRDRPLPTAACAGAFIFGSSRILRDVPFDPEIYFNGEEPSLAVRLWTHGFDLFSPNVPLIYHYYERVDGSRHWNDSVAGRMLRSRTLQRMKALCEPDACAPEEVAALGPYGLGTRRSLAEYQDFSGADFAGKTLASYARAFPYVRSGAPGSEIRLDAGLCPASGLHLFVLDDEGCLFSADKGELFRLNPSATLVWCALEEGLTWPEIGRELAERRGVTPHEVEPELRRLAAHWLGQGLLTQAATPPPPRFDAAYFDFRVHHYSLLGVVFQVRYGDRELESWVHPAIAHLAVDPADIGGAPAHALTVARILQYLFLFCDDEQLLVAESAGAIVPQVKSALLDRAVRRQDHILRLHAGAVLHDGRLILLPAASGRGKTSLTARLVAAGCEYFTDEVVLLERGTGRVRPVPVSLSVKAGGVRLLDPHFPGLAELPEHDRQDGLKVRYLRPPADSLPPPGRLECPSMLVFPRYLDGVPCRVRALSRVEALGRLLQECVAVPKPLDLADAAVLVETMEAVDCYELIGGDLDTAAAHVLELSRLRGSC